MAKQTHPKTLSATASRSASGTEKGRVLPPPSYFLTLEVENVRCFRGKAKLDLSDGKGRPAPWTILLGDNGTGKTTLLQCLAGLQPHVFLIHSWVPRLFTIPLVLGNDQLVTSGEIRGSMNSVSAIGATLRSGRPPDEVQKSVFGFTTGVIEECTQMPWRFTGLVCYGYGAGRRLGGAGLGENTTHPDACASLFDDDAALTDAEEWLLRADYTHLKFKDADAKRRFDAVKAVLTRILPGVTNIVTVQPENLSQPPFVQVEHEKSHIPLRALSSGYRSVLVWMVDLATRLFARYPESPDPLAEPAIVLVDQIDLHLHPRWQRELIGRLSEVFINTQFIVSAHSPLIVQAAAAIGANIAVLKREGDHVGIHQDVQSVRGWRVDQILASDLFDEQPSRDAVTEEKLAERRSLLSKVKLSKADKARLNALEREISPLPSGESPDDIEARMLLRQAAASLRKQQETLRHLNEPVGA